MGITSILKKASRTKSGNNTGQRISITPELRGIKINHKGKEVTISRGSNKDAQINPLFTKATRPCPPFCVQPMIVSSGVETIGELEVLEYLEKSNNDPSIMTVDTRIKEWADKGTIPGSVSIPWTRFVNEKGVLQDEIINTLIKQFNAPLLDDRTEQIISLALLNSDPSIIFDFSEAKILILYCNGTWCGQTSHSIKALLKIGYPAEKLKYYRDGMQGWETLGLTTIAANNVCRIKKPACDV
ncbi:MAG: rhodanese-like domain-containing protein [Cocleimonas sp.]